MKNKDEIRIAFCYENIDNSDQAEVHYQKAVKNGQTNANYFLAYLYQSQENKFKKAEVNYQEAIKKGNPEAAFALGNLYLGKKKFDKAQISFSNAIQHGNFDAKLMLVFMNLSVLKDAFSAESSMVQLLNENDLIDPNFKFTAERIKLLGMGFLFLLSKGHFDFLYHFFNSEKAIKLQYKDRFKPIYYALLYFLQNQYPNEYLRMGVELKETVEEIVAKVKNQSTNSAMV